MKHSTLFGLLAGTLLLPHFAHALDPPKPAAQSNSAAGTPNAPRELSWDDLLPESERNAPLLTPQQEIRPLFDDESGPAAAQNGSSQVNKQLNGVTVKLPGFIVPLGIDQQSRVTDFLLVPYFGACMHMPPPPPNQIVYVKMAAPMRLETMYDPVWVIGKLSTSGTSSQLADAAYSIAGVRTEKYEDR
jgi:uncharacterized protein